MAEETHLPAGEHDVDVLGLELLVDLGQVLALGGAEDTEEDTLEGGSESALVQRHLEFRKRRNKLS